MILHLALHVIKVTKYITIKYLQFIVYINRTTELREGTTGIHAYR